MSIASDIPADDSDSDDCLCGMEPVADEATSDEELPQASGGVEADAAEEPDDPDESDGCELDFSLDEPTRDEELPVAIGGSE
ncbi:hypothetical protein [Bradyrhizobium sp. STM 3557]|uniref:hypothetical protein n=1 Tax=Bradyrhizobium sp. STM 3557 TaxID=578920 RepID=UPI00388F8DA3